MRQAIVVIAVLLRVVPGFGSDDIKRPSANIALGKPCTLDPPPNYPHCTDPEDRNQLTDGRYTVGYFWTQPSSVGWSGVGLATVTVDLGAVQPIRGVSFNTAAGVAQVSWPLSIHVLVSDDGKNFYRAGELVALSGRHGVPPRQGYALHRFWTDALQTHGRYLSLLVTPDGPFAFVDEIEVYQGEPDWMKIPFRGNSVPDAKAFQVHSAIERRIRNDLGTVRSAAGSSGELAAELNAIERELADLSASRQPEFRAVLPLNELHQRIFRVQARLWRAQQPDPIVLWQSPLWDPLSHTQAPPRPAKPPAMTLTMMLNEYRAGAFNISNTGDQSLSLRLRVAGLPGSPNPRYVTVHEAVWTDTRSGTPVAAALPEAKRDGDDSLISVPAGMTRQVWLTFHPRDVKPGLHQGQIVLRGGQAQLSIPLILRLSDLRFPDRPTLHLGGWDYTDQDAQYDITPQNRGAVIAHLREHFVDSPWATASVLPYDQNPTNFDRWLERWPNAGQYCVFASVAEQCGGSPIGTPEFARKVGDWITFWARHAQKRGLKPAQLVILLVDEPNEATGDRIIVAWAKAIRAANAGVTIWEDPTHPDPSLANQEMMAGCHVLCPNRVMFLTGSAAFRDYYAARPAQGTELAFYSCSGPGRLLDPYSYYRLQAWTCWQYGAKASYFWAFGDSGGGSSWNEYGATRAAAFVPFFLDATSVTPGKHMEAIREGVEDYEYLVMLRDSIARAEPRGSVAAVVERAKKLLAEAANRVANAPGQTAFTWSEPKDRTVADSVRLEILETLVALKDASP